MPFGLQAFSKVFQDVAPLLSASGDDREDALDESTTRFAVGSPAHFAVTHRDIDRSLAGVVGRLDPFEAYKRPKMRFLFEQSFTDPRGLRAATVHSRFESLG